MFEVIVPDSESFNESTYEFIPHPGGRFTIEHSLLSISKWEEEWHKPFFGRTRNDHLTYDEWLDYVRKMTITKNVSPKLYENITRDNIIAINNYMKDPRTATTIRRTGTHVGWEVITSEIIYWQMIQLGIPFECQKWHINKLMTLIEVCTKKGSKPEKIPQAEYAAQRRAINEARLKQFNTRG